MSLKTDNFLSYLEVSVLTDKDNFGTYTCHASNSFGSASHVVIKKTGKYRDRTWLPQLGALRQGTGWCIDVVLPKLDDFLSLPYKINLFVIRWWD